ncbi:hypothetical protein PT2222_290098 [Paraburkholderia tropica]
MSRLARFIVVHSVPIGGICAALYGRFKDLLFTRLARFIWHPNQRISAMCCCRDVREEISHAECAEIERVRTADPHRGIAMIAQRIGGIRMHEYVETTVIKRKPCKDVGEVRVGDRELIRPHRMRPNRTLVETTDLHGIAPTRVDDFAQGPRGVARIGIEINVSVPAGDFSGIDSIHGEAPEERECGNPAEDRIDILPRIAASYSRPRSASSKRLGNTHQVLRMSNYLRNNRYAGFCVSS